MGEEETRRIILSVSTGTSILVWLYFHLAARRNTLLVYSTMNGPLPAIATWAWAVPFYAILIVIVVSPAWLRRGMIETPAWMRTLGAIAVLPSPVLFLWVFSYLGNNSTGAFSAVFSQRLVTRGPYRYVRHPLYAVECVFLAGLALATSHWIVLGYAISGILMIRLVVIPREEAYLMERFGKPYREYRKTTGTMFPKFAAGKGTAPRRHINARR